MLFWRKNRLIDAFAVELADEFCGEFPVHELEVRPGKAGRRLPRRIAKKLQYMAEQMRQFSSAQSLGVYGKARVNLKIVERLDELDYPEELIAAIKEYLLLNVA